MQFLKCIQSDRHVCGGKSELQVIEEIFVNNPYTTNDQELDHIIHACSRKARWIQNHVTHLMSNYRQSRRVAHEQLVKSSQRCSNYLTDENLENAILTDTGSLLREQYNSLLEIISVLLTMEYEEKNEENVYTHHMKSIRAASEQLLCEVYVGIGTSGGLVPNRQIPGAVPLCTYKDRIERYERDYLLLHRIKLLAQMFQQQYV